MLGRSECYACYRPADLCVCGDLVRVANRTLIQVLQHKRERFHPLGTVRFARLGLERARVAIDDPRDRAETAARFLAAPGPVGVLFPSPGARLLAEVPASERPASLIVLDGTWSHARIIARANPWLMDLPCYALEPTVPSRYRIRAEPFAAATSTIEAIVDALKVLEPELAGLDGLVEAFVRMIDRQIELGSQRVGRVRYRRRTRPTRAVPAELTGDARHLVLVFGELAPDDNHALVSWCAYRPHDGAVFERWCARGQQLTDHHLGHMGLTRAHVDAGVEAAALAEAWAAFVRPDDVLVAWNRSTLEAPLIASSRPTVLLKAVHANVRRTGSASGALADVAAREGITPVAVPVTGRAARVLGWTAAIAAKLRDEAIAEADQPVSTAVTPGAPADPRA